MTESESQVEKATSILETIQNYIFSKKGFYLLTAIVLAVGIYFYMNQKKNVENNSNIQDNQQLPIPQQFQQHPQQFQQHPQQFQHQQQQQQHQHPQQFQQPQRPTQVEFAPELLADLKKQNITPEQYLFMLQQRGDLPPGELPKIVTSQERQVEVQAENINNDLSNIHKIEDDEEDEDNNIRKQDLTNEEMENIKQKLQSLNYNQSRN